jgi:uncharacterized membrane protein YdjX (TVP38/TMEM64 family)
MINEKKLKLWLNIGLVILFIGITIVFTIKYASQITDLLKQPSKFKDLVNSYGPLSILIFISFQILQVVIAIIPGELVQLAGGYIFGTFFGTVYSTVGILIGSVIAFYITRLLGFNFIKTLISQQEMERIVSLLDKPKSEISIFLLFLIPGIPKDILVYIAGLTPVKPIRFFTIFLVARFPSLLSASFMGARIKESNYLPVIVISTIACVLFVLSMINKDKIMDRLHFLSSQKLSSKEKEL